MRKNASIGFDRFDMKDPKFIGLNSPSVKKTTTLLQIGQPYVKHLNDSQLFTQNNMDACAILDGRINAGKFDHVEPEFTCENFPVPQSLILGIEPKLYRFNNEVTAHYVTNIMNNDGYRPGGLGDLLDYVVNRSNKVRATHVFALGAYIVIQDERSYACFTRTRRLRCLDLLAFDKFPLSCRFLAVIVPKTV
jgi:hypothetical protein